jgi:transposase InsO family protein
MDSTQEVPLISNNPREIMEIDELPGDTEKPNTASEPQGTSTVEEIDSEKVLLKELKKKMLKENESIQLWHRRLAHMNPNSLKSALEKLAPKVNHDQGWDDISPCDVCIQSKHAQKFERKPTTRATAPFELIHSDLCGPFTSSVGGATYYIVYVDDYTRYTEVMFLKSKEAPEVLAKFQRFHAWIKTQGYTVKRFRCDNGRGEFNNTAFEDELAKAGITYEPAPPYTQHKNGTAERMIRTLNTKARCMMLDAKMPMRFWAEAVKTACYLHGRSPTSSLPGNKTPYEALYGAVPRINHLRRFGCTVYKYIPKEQRDSGKFSARSKPCMMLGYVHRTTKIWRIWDFTSGRGRAVQCSNVIFKEAENAYERTPATTSADQAMMPEDWPQVDDGSLSDDDDDDTGTEAINMDDISNKCTYDDDDDDDDDDDVIYDNNDDDDDDDDVIYDNNDDDDDDG